MYFTHRNGPVLRAKTDLSDLECTHPLMAASEENKLPPSFSGFKSKNFLHESSYDVVSGTDNDEQS